MIASLKIKLNLFSESLVDSFNYHELMPLANPYFELEVGTVLLPLAPDCELL